MADIKTESVESCPACGGGGAQLYREIPDYFLGSPGKWSISHCNNEACNTLWLNPRPLEQEIWKAYTSYHTHNSPTNKGLVYYVDSLLRRLTKLLLWPVYVGSGLQRQHRRLRYMFLNQRSPGVLLDIGCGGGRFLRRMKKSGWEVEGVDFDEAAASRVRDRYNITVHIGDITAVDLHEEYYDAITSSHTIEHMYDPLEALIKSYSLLKVGGNLVLTTPNANSLAHKAYKKFWRGLEPPRHIQIFTKDSLEALVKQAGFKEVQASTLSTGAAGIYKVSSGVCGKRTLSNQLSSTLKSLVLELLENKRNKNNGDVGQDILIVAKK